MEVLGNQNNIESLKRDILDVDDVISDLLSRVGPVKFQSWKYPNKYAFDVNCREVIEIYDYDNEDDETNQLTHIILFELLIDRFLFVIQLSNFLVDKSSSLSNDSTIGLSVKKFSSSLMRSLRAMTSAVNNKHSNKSRVLSATKRESRPMTANPERVSSTISLGRDEYNKAIQTIETEFVPCEECYKVQSYLKKLANTLIGVCKETAIPSSMEDHLVKIDELPWLTSSDISRWISEQNKDVSRICKHITSLSSQIPPLEKKNVLLESNLQSERNRYNVEIKKLKKEIAEIKTTCRGWRERVENLKTSLVTEEAKTKEQNDKIKMLLEKEKIYESLEKSVIETRGEMEAVRDQLQSAQKEIDILSASLTNVKNEREKIRNENSQLKDDLESAVKVKEVFKTKQSNLLSDIEEIADENGNLRKKLAQLERNYEEKLKVIKRDIDTEEHLHQLKRELERLHDREMSRVERENDELIRKCEDLREKIKTIVKYPETAPPPSAESDTETSDVLSDMKRQMNANSLRIDTLKDENRRLAQSIGRISKAMEPSLHGRSKTYTKECKGENNFDLLEVEDRPSTLHSDIDRYDFDNMTDAVKSGQSRWAESSCESRHISFSSGQNHEGRRKSDEYSSEEAKVRLWQRDSSPIRRAVSANKMPKITPKIENPKPPVREGFNPSLMAYTKLKQASSTKKAFEATNCQKCGRNFSTVSAKELHYLNCRKR